MNIEQTFLARKDNPLYNTSYPLQPSDWMQYRVDGSLSFDKEGEISFYIHIPFCKQLCSFCEYTRMVCPDENAQHQYVNTINKDVSSFVATHCNRMKLRGFDIGGGTPTALSEANLKNLLQTFSETLDWMEVTPDFEPSIEGTFNTLTKVKLSMIARSGIKRLSLGVQSTSKNVLCCHHRASNDVEFMKSWMDKAHDAGIEKINLDLMYGLKGQDDESIAQDLNVISQLNPEQVTLYELRTNMIALKELPDKDALYQQYCLFYDGLIQQGYYARFGQNTFSKSPDDLGVSSYLRSRMIEGIAYKGFGISAQSMSSSGVSYNIGKSNDRLRELLTADSFTEEYTYYLPPKEIASKYIAISAYNGSVSLARLEEILKADPLVVYAAQLDYLQKEKLIEIMPNRIHITPKGFRYYGSVFSLLYVQ